MTKNVGLWGGLLVAGLVSVLGCDQLERKPRPQAVEPDPVVQEDNWKKVATPEGKIIQLSLGYDHSCALYEEGEVACWGSNAFGQLGLPLETKSSFEPKKLQGESIPKFEQIVAGDNVTCGIVKIEKTMYCWGRNSDGQLGLGESAPQSEKPVQIKRDNDAFLTKVTQIYSDYNAVCAIVEGEGPLCWGTTPYVRSEKDAQGKETRVIGQLVKAKTPTKVNTGPMTGEFGPPWDGGKTRDLVILRDDVCSITERNIRCVKAKVNIEPVESLSGRDATLYYSLTTKHAVFALSPSTGKVVEWKALPDKKGTVAPGGAHACSLFEGDSAFCWGNNEYGQLGFDGSASPAATYPLPALKISQLASGARHSCAVEEKDESQFTWCWGGNDQGQSGEAPSKRTREKSEALENPEPVEIGSEVGTE